MARSFASSSSQYIVAENPYSDYPLTLSVLTYPTASVAQACVALSDASNTSRRLAINRTTTQRFAMFADSGTQSTTVNTLSNTAPSNEWHHVGLAAASPDNRWMLLNGEHLISSTVSRDTSGCDRFVVAARVNSGGPAAPYDGNTAWACIRNVAMTVEELAVEAETRNPFTVRPETIRHFWQLWGMSPEKDLVGGLDLVAVNSPGVVEHPWITLPGRQLWLPQQVAAPPDDDREASGSLTLPALTLSGAVDTTVPEFDTTAALELPAVTLSGAVTTGTPDVDVSGSLTLAPLTLSSSVEAEPPEFDTSGTLTLGALTLSASVDAEVPEYDVSGTLTLAPLTLNASVDTTLPEGAVVGSLTLSPLTLSGTVDAEVPTFDVAGTLTIGAVTLSGTVVVDVAPEPPVEPGAVPYQYWWWIGQGGSVVELAPLHHVTCNIRVRPSITCNVRVKPSVSA